MLYIMTASSRKCRKAFIYNKKYTDIITAHCRGIDKLGEKIACPSQKVYTLTFKESSSCRRGEGGSKIVGAFRWSNVAKEGKEAYTHGFNVGWGPKGLVATYKKTGR